MDVFLGTGVMIRGTGSDHGYYKGYPSAALSSYSILRLANLLYVPVLTAGRTRDSIATIGNYVSGGLFLKTFMTFRGGFPKKLLTVELVTTVRVL